MDEEEEINVKIVMNNNTDVTMTCVERILPTSTMPRLADQLHTVALVLVLVGNSYVVKRILENSKTFLDWLVVTDSFLCLGAIGKL